MVEINAILVGQIQPRDEKEKEAIQFVRFEMNEIRSGLNHLELASVEEEEDVIKVAIENVQSLSNILKSKLDGLKDQPNKSENMKSMELKIQIMVDALQSSILNPPLSSRLNPNTSFANSAMSEININDSKNPFDIKIPLSLTRVNSTKKNKKIESLENTITKKDVLIQNLQKNIQFLEAPIEATANENKKQASAEENYKKSLDEKDHEIERVKKLNADITEKHKIILSQLSQRDELILKLKVQLQFEDQKETVDVKDLKFKNSELIKELEHEQETRTKVLAEKFDLFNENQYLIKQLDMSETQRNKLQREMYKNEDIENSYQHTLELLELTKK